MSAHTPGPWTANGHAVFAGEKKLCDTDLYDLEESLANARLMAAAPDLLDACRFVLDADRGRAWMSQAIKAVVDVVAKAEGREP
jgi:hypothetical protein